MKHYQGISKLNSISLKKEFNISISRKNTFSSFDFSLFDKDKEESNREKGLVTKPVVKHYPDLKRDNEFCLMEPVNNEERCYFMMKSKNYFNSIVNNKLNRVINYIRNTVSDIIITNIKDISLHRELIKYLLIENKKNKSRTTCLANFCSFIKCNSKHKLNKKHNMKEKSMNIYNEYKKFIYNACSLYSEQNIRNLIRPDTEEDVKKVKEHINRLFELEENQNKGFEDIITKAIDNYYLFLYIEKVIKKQEDKLKAQNEKLHKIENILNDNSCIICMEHQRSVVFVPCMHLICCKKCSMKNVNKECAECKAQIKEMISTV